MFTNSNQLKQPSQHKNVSKRMRTTKFRSSIKNWTKTTSSTVYLFSCNHTICWTRYFLWHKKLWLCRHTRHALTTLCWISPIFVHLLLSINKICHFCIFLKPQLLCMMYRKLTCNHNSLATHFYVHSIKSSHTKKTQHLHCQRQQNQIFTHCWIIWVAINAVVDSSHCEWRSYFFFFRCLSFVLICTHLE